MYLGIEFGCGCRASLEYLKVSGAKPDIIHTHEWQLSAVPMLYWEAYASQGLPGARLVSAQC